MKLDKFWH